MQLSISQRIVNRLANWKTLEQRPATLDRGVLSVTFDDFPRSAWTRARPILDRYDVRATYYVSGVFTGAQNRGFDHHTEQDLSDLVDSGHEIGCHTFGHLSAFEADADRYSHSCAQNAAFLETVLPGYRMDSFAFPYGHVRLSHRKALADRYATLRGIHPSATPSVVDRTLVAAVGLEAGHPEVNWQGLIEQAAREHRWVVLFTHEVEDSPSPYGTRPDDLERVLDSARKAGLTFATVGETWKRLAA